MTNGSDDSIVVSAESHPAEPIGDVVETALAKALTLAAEAGRWEVVSQLADELKRREMRRQGERSAEAGKVVDLDARRRS